MSFFGFWDAAKIRNYFNICKRLTGYFVICGIAILICFVCEVLKMRVFFLFYMIFLCFFLFVLFVYIIFASDKKQY